MSKCKCHGSVKHRGCISMTDGLLMPEWRISPFKVRRRDGEGGIIFTFTYVSGLKNLSTLSTLIFSSLFSAMDECAKSTMFDENSHSICPLEVIGVTTSAGAAKTQWSKAVFNMNPVSPPVRRPLRAETNQQIYAMDSYGQHLWCPNELHSNLL